MKIWAYVAALAILAGLVGGLVHMAKKASRVDAAEARADAAENGRHDDMVEVVKRLDKDAEERKALNGRLDAIDKRFDDIHIPEPGKLIQWKEKPGDPCPAVSIGPEFVSVFNQTSLETGSPAPETH